MGFLCLHTDHYTAVQRKKPSTGHTKISNGGDEYNFEISSRDNNGIDDSEDDSESDDSEHSDQEEDGHDRSGNSTPWPSSPPLPPVNGRTAQHAKVTASSSSGFTLPSSTALDSSSSDRMVSSPRGKLPSVTKLKERRAQEASKRTTLPSTRVGAQSLSTAKSHQNLSSLQQRFLAKEANIRETDASLSIMGALSSTTHERRRSRDDFEPEPIEQDLLDLSAKYDETVPRENRALGGAGVAEATAAGDAGRQGILPEQRTNGSMPQHPQSDRSDMSSASVRSSGRKRAAPTLLLSPRPSRHCSASVDNLSSNPTHILPDHSESAAAPNSNTAPIGDTSRVTAAKTFLEICTTAKIKRHAVHVGCRAGLPCRDHKGPAPVPSNPRTSIHRNTISERRPATFEEAEYILSRANCFWARNITVLWTDWCDGRDEKRSQVEWLLGSFPELLVGAARKCCPKEVIEID